MKQLSIQTKVIAGFTILSIITVIFIGLYLKTINERNEYRLIKEEVMKYNEELVYKIAELTKEIELDENQDINTSDKYNSEDIQTIQKQKQIIQKQEMLIGLLNSKASLYKELCEAYKKKIAILEELNKQ